MNGVEDVIQSSWGANLQNVPIATAVLSDSGRSKAAMSAKRQPHTDELSKVPSHGVERCCDDNFEVVTAAIKGDQTFCPAVSGNKHYLPTRRNASDGYCCRCYRGCGWQSVGVTQTRFVGSRRKQRQTCYQVHTQPYLTRQFRGAFSFDSDKGRFRAVSIARRSHTHKTSMLQRLRRSSAYALTIFGEVRPPFGTSQNVPKPEW